jgi:hypothetical protein
MSSLMIALIYDNMYLRKLCLEILNISTSIFENEIINNLFTIQ